MDLDDSFTEGLLQSIKARRDYIKEKKEDIFLSGKKRAALNEDLQENSDVSPEESPKRQCTGKYAQTTYSRHNKENIEITDDSASDFVPYSVSKARGLAALKKKFSNDDDDEIGFSKAPEQQETPTSTNSSNKNIAQMSCEKSPINSNLVEDYHADDHIANDESIDEDDFAENYDDIKSDDEASNMELDFFPGNSKVQDKPNEQKKFKAFTKLKSPVSQESAKTNVDPAELPLSARKALFEKAFINGTPKINDSGLDPGKLSVAQRAAMFENASKSNAGAKAANFKEPKRMVLSNFEKFENKNTNVHKSPVKPNQPAIKNMQEMKALPAKTSLQASSPVKKPLQMASPVKKTVSDSGQVFLTPSPTKNVGNHTRLIQQKLMESTGSNWQEKQAAKAAEERKQELSSLVNHWEKLSSSSSAESEKAPLVREEEFSCKSDTVYEENESEEESEPWESENGDLNENVLEHNCLEDKDELSSTVEHNDADSTVTKTEILNEDFYSEVETENIISVEKNSGQNFNNVSNCTSNSAGSFTSSCYSDISSVPSDSNYQASKSQSCSSGASVFSYGFIQSKAEEVFLEKTEKKENKNPEINLLRTVSAYRRAKQETKLTPVRTVVRREKISSPESPPDTDFTEVIQQRLKDLQDEILRQQIVISQSSQALNLCSASAEFSGSTEQVEGERLLLIATQKRQACLNEITRLKTCGAQGEIIEGTGTLTITDLQLPLKREFIASQLEGRGTDTVHYFLCLIRHGAQVIVTQMMSTDERNSDGTLSFTNHIQLRNLSADFSVVFEVYALQTKKEVLPHEKKYHIKRENSKRRLTPKGKKTDGKIPAVCSPGGPNAVRSPSFGVVGFTRFNLQNCNKKTFTLDKVPFTSPLEGVLKVKVKLHAQHKVMLKGFLTFYEDVGEIGALYRRWCVLDGSTISYWLYPDDEHKKEPLGYIDLRQCVTGTVKLVSTLECARSHTFKLVTVRPQKKGDRDTLISRTVNTLTTTKYLLTADTKDERILWCNKINEALENVRKWDPQALRPTESMNI